MKYGIWILVIVGVITLAMIGFYANRPIHHPQVAADTFYYYPKPNIYYSKRDDRYIFWNTGEAAWLTGAALPDSLAQQLDEKVVLYDQPDSVWKNNEKHRMLYAVYFYADSTDFKDKPAPPIVKKLPKTVQQDTEQHRESGIKRFLKRLFKGKDKS